MNHQSSRRFENINIPEVHDETSVLPFDNSDAFKFVGKDITLIDLSRVLVRESGVLPDGGRINLVFDKCSLPLCCKSPYTHIPVFRLFPLNLTSLILLR